MKLRSNKNVNYRLLNSGNCCDCQGFGKKFISKGLLKSGDDVDPERQIIILNVKFYYYDAYNYYCGMSGYNDSCGSDFHL